MQNQIVKYADFKGNIFLPTLPPCALSFKQRQLLQQKLGISHNATVTQKRSSQVRAPSIISNYMIISSRHWSNPSLWAVCFLLLLNKMKSSSRTPLLWRRQVFVLSNQNLFRTSLYMFVPALSVVLNLNCFSSPWYLVPWCIYRKIISSFKLHFARNSNVRNRLTNLLQWIGTDRHTHRG